MTHPKVLTHPLSVKKAMEDFKPYLNDPRCRILTETPRHGQTIEEILKRNPSAKGNFIHDCHYAALLKEHAVEDIVTADTDFKKFDFLRVISPFQED